MSYRPLYFTDITDYVTDRKLEYALLKKEIVNPVLPHRHGFLELSYVLEGCGSETINGKQHPLGPGTISLLLPYHVHELESSPSHPLKIYNLALSLDAIFSAGSGFGLRELLFTTEQQPAPFLQLDEKNAKRIAALFDEMYEENMSGRKWASFVVKSKLVEILVIYDRLGSPSQALSPNGEDSRNDVFWNIVQYIHNNFSENITLDSLEQQFHIRTYGISKLFKSKTGENFHRFLNQLRIQHACSLLISTDMTVIDIAMETGFESYITFSKIFREYTGMNAVKYRKSRETPDNS